MSKEKRSLYSIIQDLVEGARNLSVVRAVMECREIQYRGNGAEFTITDRDGKNWTVTVQPSDD